MLLPQRGLRGMFVTAPAPPGREGEAGARVVVVSLPGRRAAGGRPQGRP
jgi:hypothetical protein